MIERGLGGRFYFTLGVASALLGCTQPNPNIPAAAALSPSGVTVITQGSGAEEDFYYPNSGIPSVNAAPPRAIGR
jgi:hypothetical protein